MADFKYTAAGFSLGLGLGITAAAAAPSKPAAAASASIAAARASLTTAAPSAPVRDQAAANQAPAAAAAPPAAYGSTQRDADGQAAGSDLPEFIPLDLDAVRPRRDPAASAEPAGPSNQDVALVGQKPYWMKFCSRIGSPLLRLHQGEQFP